MALLIISSLFSNDWVRLLVNTCHELVADDAPDAEFLLAGGTSLEVLNRERVDAAESRLLVLPFKLNLCLPSCKFPLPVIDCTNHDSGIDPPVLLHPKSTSAGSTSVDNTEGRRSEL